ncbi:hypothetical protein BH09DEP1_BH09DEP1_5240 [soil metagenome]
MAQPVKTILDGILSHQNNWQLQLLNQWPTIVQAIKTRVHLLKIEPDTLTIGVQDSCWLQELYLLSPLLIATINQKLDEPRIKQLRFKALGTQETKQKKETTQRVRPKRIVTLSPKEQATLAQIADEQLRNSLKNYLIRCYEER